jgi:oligoendopeptidase F
MDEDRIETLSNTGESLPDKLEKQSYQKSEKIQEVQKVENDKKESKNSGIYDSSQRVSWKLDKLFATDEDWEKEVKNFKGDVKELKNYLGKATKSPTHLLFALEVKEKLDIRLEKLSAYTKLSQDVNKSDYKYSDMGESISKVATDYTEITSKLESEIAKMPLKTYTQAKRNYKINKKYGKYLTDVRRNKSRYLDPQTESILNKASYISSLPGTVYELFSNMDKDIGMTPGQYATDMENSDRAIRKKSYQKEYGTYYKNINTLSGLLAGQVKKNIFYAQARGYKDARDMYLDSDHIDERVYDNLINTVNNRLDGLHKYTALRKKELGVDKVCAYDLNAPIVKPVDKEISYDTAQGIIYTTFAPLGKEYSDTLYRAFNENWIDVYSGKKKVGGAYSLSIYGDHPYVLLNYNNSLDSVSTLAHELGHAVYSYLSENNQSYSNATPSIFTHEVASITNESLLYERLIKEAKNKDEKAYYISQYLDLIKSTLFTQTMYAEFEREIHDKIEKGENVNAAVMNDIWGNLLQKYNGKDFKVDEFSKSGWARIPHFYDSFYVYKYATGLSAALTFVDDIQKNGAENYVSFLKEGGSDEPLKLLKKHNVNLSDTKPIEKAIDKFDSLLAELEKLT